MMRRPWMACLCLALCSSIAHAEFRAGAHAQDVTPARPTLSTSGAMVEITAKGVHDPLFARCLVLDDGQTAIAIAIVDSCMIDRELMDHAKSIVQARSGIATQNILIAATHTHTAPAVVGVFQSKPNLDYRRFLIEQIAEGIDRAKKNLEPAEAGWATGSDPTQVFNRRWRVKDGESYENPFGGKTDRARMNPGYNNPIVTEPVGPTDPAIPMLSIRARDGRPIALLANYALHYVGGVPPLSGDYFGEFSRRIADKIGAKPVDGKPPFVGILSNGASGDINNVNYGLEQRPPRKNAFEQIRDVAESVSKATMKAHAAIQHRSDVTLAMIEREIDLSVRRPNLDELKRAHEILAAAPRIEKGPYAGQFRDRKAIYARESVLLAEYPPTVRVKLQAIRIGDGAIAAAPCETFVEVGLAVKQQSPFKHQMFVELANGYNGYLPTPHQHQLGGYETWRARSSYLATDASPKVESTLAELLQTVKPR